jgi:hypothetical protein
MDRAALLATVMLTELCRRGVITANLAQDSRRPLVLQ